MRRREFIALLGGTAATWPLAARAQQAVRTRRIGALMSIAENDSQSTVWSSAFERGLTEHGWKPGSDLQIEYRWANDENLYRRFARELLAATPEVVLAVSGSSASALQEVTSTVPVVFMATSDPVNRRLIATMEKPGGNFTGFIEFEPGIGAKWLELLKKITPNVTRVAVLRDPTRFSWRSLVTAIEKGGAVTQRGCGPDRRARRNACHHRIRRQCEQRPDRYAKRLFSDLSRADYRPCQVTGHI